MHAMRSEQASTQALRAQFVRRYHEVRRHMASRALCSDTSGLKEPITSKPVRLQRCSFTVHLSDVSLNCTLS